MGCDPARLAAVAAVGLGAGLANTWGGGGSLLTLPVLFLLGVPPDVANATNRVGVVVQSAAATAAMHRRGVLELRRGLILLGPACLGALLGARASVALHPDAFKRVVGLALILVIPTLFVPEERWTRLRGLPAALRLPVFVFLGFYGGFLQAGVGVLLLAALAALEGLDLVRANAIKSLLVFGFTVPALAVFLAWGLVDWPVALALAAGSAAGGWTGGLLAVRFGAPILRWIVALLAAVLAIDLIVA